MMNECVSVAIAESLGSIFNYNLLVILHMHTTFLHFSDVLFAQNKTTLYLYFHIFNTSLETPVSNIQLWK